MRTDKIQTTPVGFQQGFTITELITVIVIVGILSAVAIPKMFDRGVYDSRGFYDQTLATIRFAQKSAIAKRKFVCVSFPADNSITLTYGTTAACADGTLVGPAGTSYPIVNTRASYAGFPLAAFSFNALGSPIPQNIPNIQVNGYPVAIVVEGETGYVH